MNPPIITTTAATPQDSPIATLAHGMSFSEWENNCCLKPPSVVGSVKALNNLLLPEPYPSKRKMENTSTRNANTSSIDLEPKASISNIKMERKDSADSRNGNQTTGTKSKTKKSIKKRSSTKRKEKPPSVSGNYETDMLNNERLDSLGSIDVMHKSGKRIQNNTKNTNKISPRGRQFEPNEFCNNAPRYYSNQYIENQQQMSMQTHRGSAPCRRRLSTMDPQAFKKLANLDLEQLEMLRERALRRDQQLKGVTPEEVKVTKPDTPPVCKSFVREPFKFTTAALRKRFEVLTENREDYSLYIFAEDNKFRHMCDWFVTQKWFDNVILLFIALNCITLAMERPNIPPNCTERYFLATANYVFTFVFTLEMFVKVSVNWENFHFNQISFCVRFLVHVYVCALVCSFENWFLKMLLSYRLLQLVCSEGLMHISIADGTLWMVR